MATRSTRSQPFCWQEKSILRELNKRYDGAELVKYRNLYLTLTQIDSDFNNQDINFYAKTVATYSGLPRDWIPKALKVFEQMGIIEIKQHYDQATKRPLHKELIFTPEKREELTNAFNHVNVNQGNVNNVTVNQDTLEDSSLLEDSIPLEEKTPQPKNGCLKFDKSSLEMRMTNFAIKQIQKSHPGKQFTSKEKQKHCAVFDKLIRLDKKTQKNIKDVLMWIPTAPRNNGFCWSDVFLSPASLRKKNNDDVTKFEKMYASMSANNKPADSEVQPHYHKKL